MVKSAPSTNCKFLKIERLSPRIIDDVNFRYSCDVTQLFALEVGDDFLSTDTSWLHLNCFSKLLAGTYGLSRMKLKKMVKRLYKLDFQNHFF